MSSISKIKTALVGMAMGVAEAIPGISGGTIAFIFKIYEELLETIKAVNPQNIKLLFQGKFKEFFSAINAPFLISLLIGMGIGLVGGVFGIGYLIENYQVVLWSFFFGLIFASAFYFAKDVFWRPLQLILLIVGIVLSYIITTIAPSGGNTNLVFVFFSGVIAISALMLPGLSGSFILLLMGMYTTIVGTLKNFLKAPSFGNELIIISTFALGCLVGLFSFARILSYTFKKYFQETMAFMIGILLGSLNKIWPWKQPITVFDKDSGTLVTWKKAQDLALDHFEIIEEINILPHNYAHNSDPFLLLSIIAFIIGMSIIGITYLYERKSID